MQANFDVPQSFISTFHQIYALISMEFIIKNDKQWLQIFIILCLFRFYLKGFLQEVKIDEGLSCRIIEFWYELNLRVYHR